MTQDKESGGKAAKFGLRAAAAVGEKIGAKKVNPRANEFEFKGQRVTIRMAHLDTNQVGVLYSMLERVQAVIGAFEISTNEYELLSVPSATFKQSLRDSNTGNGRVGLVRKSVFVEKGKLVANVTLPA